MHTKPDLRVLLKWMIYRSGSVIVAVIRLKYMKPSSYLYAERDGRFQLYLGGFPTLHGLRLFPDAAYVSNVFLYTDTDVDSYRPSTNGTVASLVGHISAIPGHVGIVDFSCDISGYASFSTHDDCECHFDAADCGVIRDLIFATAPDAVQSRLWATLQATPDCYTVVSPDNALQTHPDFDSLLASQDGG